MAVYNFGAQATKAARGGRAAATARRAAAGPKARTVADRVTAHRGGASSGASTTGRRPRMTTQEALNASKRSRAINQANARKVLDQRPTNPTVAKKTAANIQAGRARAVPAPTPKKMGWGKKAGIGAGIFFGGKMLFGGGNQRQSLYGQPGRRGEYY